MINGLKRIFGMFLICGGLFIICWILFFSYKVIKGKTIIPQFISTKTKTQKIAIKDKMPKTPEELEAFVNSLISIYLDKFFNVLSFFVISIIFIVGGAQLMLLGFKLVKRR